MHVLGAGLQTRSMRELHPDLARGRCLPPQRPAPRQHPHRRPHDPGPRLRRRRARLHRLGQGPPGRLRQRRTVDLHRLRATTSTRRAALVFPCVRVQQDYGTSRTSSGCASAGSGFPRCGTATTSPRSAPPGSASGGCRRSIERYGLETIKAFVGEWLDYSERWMEQAIRKLPARHARAPLPARPDPRPARRGRGEGRRRGRPRAGDGHVRPARQPGLHPVRAQRLRGTAPAAAARSRCSTASTRTSRATPAASGAIEVLIARGLDRRRPGRAVLGLGVDHERAQPADQRRAERVLPSSATGQGLAEGAGALGVGFAVFSGDPRNGRPVRQPDGDRQQRRPGVAALRRLDHLCDARLREDGLHRQRRGARAKYPLRFRSLRLLPDSRRAGRLRGGPASEVVYGPSATPMRAFYLADFALNPPQGVLGGEPRTGGVRQRHRAPTAANGVTEPVGDSLLEPGEWIRGVEAGGGGYGDPLERDPEARPLRRPRRLGQRRGRRRGLRRRPGPEQGPRRPARRRGRDAAASRGPAGDRDQARRSGELSHGSLDDPEATAVHYGPTDRYLWCTGPEE